ncbi:hypothetical protein [Algoriphagus sp.]|uniref:hypothetical protein n=1 Tax=Algoriphagus sp. TaxID=1872435 RepID=UPI0025F04B9E|nr:hypothetical protein [Algoriphagus sp.]
MKITTLIRNDFYFFMGLVFWLIMMIGFSDNWLFDVGQPSNSIPRLIIHGLFAFLWYSLFLIQAGLIRKRKIGLHRKLGIVGIFIFAGMTLSTGYLFLAMYLRNGDLNPLSYMTSSQWVFGVVLVVIAYLKRRSDTRSHKMNMLFANLWFIQAAMDRFVERFIPSLDSGYPDFYIPVWFLFYGILFATLIWYYKKIPWQLSIGFIIWTAGFIYAFINNDF